MKRSVYQNLLTWKPGKNRKPLLLQGERQVCLKFCGLSVSYPESGNFLMDNKYLFEVGGTNKTTNGEYNPMIQGTLYDLW